jgi:hypothetical protein
MSRARQIGGLCFGTLTVAMLVALSGVPAQDADRAQDDSLPQRGGRRGRGSANANPTRSTIDADRAEGDTNSNRESIDTSNNQRQVYRVSYMPAVSLAATLEKHFRGVPGVSLIAEPASNSLLISAPRERIADVADTLAKLDRAPRLATVDVTILDMSDEDDRKEVNIQEFVGPSAKVRARVNELKKSGQIQRARRFRMTVLDNQFTSLQANGDKPGAGNAQPFVGGFPGAGGLPAGVARQNAARLPGSGTTIQCTARIAADRPIVIELAIHDTPANRDPQPAPDEVAAHFLGTLSINPSSTVVAGEIAAQTENGPSRIVILVSAAVVQAPAE